MEILNGTSGNDTFNALIDNDGTTNNSTYQSGDQLNGGAGTDTLNLTIADMAGTPLVDLNSVEVVNIRNLDAGAATVKADTWVGTTQVWTRNSSADVNVTGLQNLVTAGLDTTTTALYVEFADSVVAGTADTLAIAAKDAGTKATATAATVSADDTSNNGNVIEAVSLDSAGTYNLVDIDGVGNKVKTITVTGAAAAKIEADNTAVVTINASAATGGVEVVDTAGAFAGTATDGITVTGGAGGDTIAVALTNKATVDMGAGNDVVTISDVANLTTADSIKGGEGTDVLAMAAADAKTVAANAARTVITGFEVLRLTGNFDGTGTTNDFDISKFGINSLQLAGDVTVAAADITGFTSGATVELRYAGDQTAALNVGMKNATDAGTDNDTLNIKLNADLVNQTNAAAAFEVKLGVDGINILNVTTADRDNTDGATKGDDGYILTLSNDANVSTINVSGDRELSYTSSGTDSALKLVDATSLTGDLIVDLSTFAGTQGVEVKGGAGVNTITGSGLADIIVGGAKDDVLVGGAGNDKISGGDGKDTITGGTGADILTGGAGVDTFVIAAGDSLVATADTITDLVFGVGGDVIKFGNTAATAANIKSLSAAAQANVSAAATLAAAATQVAIETSGAKIVTVFTYGSDTYLMYNDANDDTFDNGADALVKITGVTGSIDISNIYVA